jgi:hypothetical protein
MQLAQSMLCQSIDIAGGLAAHFVLKRFRDAGEVAMRRLQVGVQDAGKDGRVDELVDSDLLADCRSGLRAARLNVSVQPVLQVRSTLSDVQRVCLRT